jgi:hypothetical protein
MTKPPPTLDDRARDSGHSSAAPALIAGLPGVAGATAATCGAACAGACAPGLLGLLGVSSSSAALSWFVGLRPIFIAISLVALAIAFRRAYRRPPDSGRSFLESRSFVWLMALVSLALFGLPLRSSGAGSQPSIPCDRPCDQPCPR